MTNTPPLSLPWLAAAQAQQHVTVNEALSLIDALAQPLCGDLMCREAAFHARLSFPRFLAMS